MTLLSWRRKNRELRLEGKIVYGVNPGSNEQADSTRSRQVVSGALLVLVGVMAPVWVVVDASGWFQFPVRGALALVLSPFMIVAGVRRLRGQA